jgi:hypothetical protein
MRLLSYVKLGFMNNRTLALPVITLIVIAAFMSLYMGYLRGEIYLQNPMLAALQATSHGVSATPFQYRFLMPWLIDHVATWFALPMRPTVRYYETLMAFASALALFAYLFRICRDGWVASVFALGFFYLYPFLYINVPWTRAYYSSDTASILLFTLGLFFLYGRNYWQYYIVLAIGMFNRETIAFLLLAFAFSQYSLLERRPYLLHMLGQIMLVAAIKLWLAYLFRYNPGAGMYSLDVNLSQNGLPATLQSSRLYMNTMLFFRWDSLITLTSFMGFLWLPMIFLWNKVHDKFVRSTGFIIPCFIAGMYVVGNIFEFRIFGELVPIFLGTLCHIAAGAKNCMDNPHSEKII